MDEQHVGVAIVTLERKNRGSYSTGLATRESILNAAMSLISRRGFDGISLRDIGREVGISHPAVIYHFPSKDALLRSLIARMEEASGLVDIVEDVESGEVSEARVIPENLFEFAVALMRLANHPDAAIVIDMECILSVEAASATHPAHEHFKARFHAVHDFLESEVERLAAEGTVQTQSKAGEVAKTLMQIWFGLELQSRYSVQEDRGRQTIAIFLAKMWRVLKIDAVTTLKVGQSIPEELGDIYARFLRIAGSFAD